MRHSKSGLLLMEIIICIFFFALSATVCVQLFAFSHASSKNNVIKNHAVITVENLAESFYATYGDIDKIAENYLTDTAVVNGNTLSLYMDKDFSSVTDSDYSYTAMLSIAPADESGLIIGNVSYYSHYVTADGTEKNELVYEMDLTVYRQKVLD